MGLGGFLNLLAKLDVPATAAFGLFSGLGFAVGKPRIRVLEYWPSTTPQGEFFDATVPTPFLFVMVYAGFMPIIALLEFFVSRRKLSLPVSAAVRNAIHVSFIGLTLGLFMNIHLEEAGKNAVGLPRPEFGILCYGERELLREAAMNFDVITSNEDCPANIDGSMDGRLNVARQSYISGHASLSIGAAGYTAIYLIGTTIRHFRAPAFVWLRQFVLVAAITLPFGFGGYISISRVWDGKHSGADVLTGMVVGLGSAFFTAWWISASYELNNAETKAALAEPGVACAGSDEEEKS